MAMMALPIWVGHVSLGMYPLFGGNAVTPQRGILRSSSNYNISATRYKIVVAKVLFAIARLMPLRWLALTGGSRLGTARRALPCVGEVV